LPVAIDFLIAAHGFSPAMSHPAILAVTGSRNNKKMV